jgi:hypothetical protein
MSDARKSDAIIRLYQFTWEGFPELDARRYFYQIKIELGVAPYYVIGGGTPPVAATYTVDVPTDYLCPVPMDKWDAMHPPYSVVLPIPHRDSLTSAWARIVLRERVDSRDGFRDANHPLAIKFDPSGHFMFPMVGTADGDFRVRDILETPNVRERDVDLGEFARFLITHNVKTLAGLRVRRVQPTKGGIEVACCGEVVRMDSPIDLSEGDTVAVPQDTLDRWESRGLIWPADGKFRVEYPREFGPRTESALTETLKEIGGYRNG